MNLNFQTVKRLKIDNKIYLLQVADVTRNKSFWINWRHAKKVEAEAMTLNAIDPVRRITSVISISREYRGKTLCSFAWRLYPEHGKDPGSFACAYKLTDLKGILPYQKRAVSHICSSLVCNGAAIDGSDTGIGKTYVAASVCRNMKMTPAVICRKAGISTWKKVLRSFGLNPLFIVNWEFAKSEKMIYTQKYRGVVSGKYAFKWLLPGKHILLIFDEAHMGNSDTSQNYALWTGAMDYYTLSISATFADKPRKLQGLFQILKIFKPHEFRQYLIRRSHFVNKYNEVEGLNDSMEMKDFNKILYPRYGYRLSYNDPDVKKFFPRGVFRTVTLNIGNEQERRQNDLYQKLLLRIEEYKRAGKSAQAMTANLRYRQATELLKVPVLIDTVKNYVYQNRSVLVFVNFKETLFALSKALRTRSLIYGGQESDGIFREEVISRFQKDREAVILLMAAAGGQSISLHDLNGKRPRISIITPTYNPIDLKQILGRTYRSGARTVPVMQLVYAANTIEEQVAENVSRKLANISALNDGDLMEPDIFGILKT